MIAHARPAATIGSRRRTTWRGPGWRILDASPVYGKEVRDWISRVTSWPGCLADPGDAAVVVSELFANALRHGPACGRILVGYCLWREGARIVVCDAGGITAPRLRDPAELEESGRGLLVVAMIAAAWGSFRAGLSQVVWCDLGTPLTSVAASDAWAWLLDILAADALAPPCPASRPGGG